MAPKLNTYIKTHKENEPIRPVINNTQAPSYKLAKYINKKLYHLLNLPNAYNTKNSQEIAEELKNVKINENTRIITLDIKDLYMNLPPKVIIKATRHWLNKNNNNREIINQVLNILWTIMKQNYFQYKDKFYQPERGKGMGSPISGTMAETYLQYIEETNIKQWWDTGEIIHYRRYVDDIIIIYDTKKIQDNIIEQEINKIDENLQFKMTTEDNNTINYLDLTLKRSSNTIDLSIYRKATNTDTTIHYQSNHPYEHKIAAFRYYVNRMNTLPITEK